ncbi:MAG TPA: hypothetical protein VG867_03490 [Rhizomicrobium sp.]|nr:hypothetical protein [Rhizomicrobium sp.]
MAPKDSATQARLAQALRENLKRRKAAQRARAQAEDGTGQKEHEKRPIKVQKPD